MASGAVIYVRDLSGMASFYAAVAGLPLTCETDAYCELGEGLVLVRIPGSVVVPGPPEPRESSAVKPVFTVEDIAVARAAATAHGGTVLPPDREWRFHRWTVCDGHDPEGNVIQLRTVQQGR